ncbi:SEFIR domain-containing protein [Amycolatopsis samaneae]|uniref:SEFIR domain-containing protein n=1 Tax=Amycolatopsis samaneae TaxID=664691 RepID=A0ABW5GBN5_9PSEU
MIVAEPDETSRSPKVYVSYARDSARHVEQVVRFAGFLRERAGIETLVDEWETAARRDRVAWISEEYTGAEFVLVIVSPEYGRLAGSGLTQLENALINNDLGRDVREATRRILPVVLPDQSVDDIPPTLLPYSATKYVVDDLTLDGIRDLVRVIYGAPEHVKPPLGPFLPPVPGVDPIVVAERKTTPGRSPILVPGTEALVGDEHYLVHGDTFEERITADGAAVTRSARALRIGASRGYVWLRQAELRQRTPLANAVAAALVREHRLLTAPTGRTPGMPESARLAEEDGVVTLATGWPPTRTGAPCDTLAVFLPEPGEHPDLLRTRGFLRELAGVCRILAVMHGKDTPHRCLTPAGLIRLDDGRLVLRDLGLAAVAYEPGEGPDLYRAPEQRRSRQGRAGPWTDVYQLAAVAYHLATGHVPVPPNPVPIHGLVPDLPRPVGEALDRALAADPGARPDVSALASALRNA